MNDETFELPRRLRELEPRTVEFLARLNEPERENLVHMSNMSVKKRERLEKFLSLPEEEFNAGISPERQPSNDHSSPDCRLVPPYPER